jgi:hypothetical protein
LLIRVPATPETAALFPSDSPLVDFLAPPEPRVEGFSPAGSAPVGFREALFFEEGAVFTVFLRVSFFVVRVRADFLAVLLRPEFLVVFVRLVFFFVIFLRVAFFVTFLVRAVPLRAGFFVERACVLFEVDFFLAGFLRPPVDLERALAFLVALRDDPERVVLVAEVLRPRDFFAPARFTAADPVDRFRDELFLAGLMGAGRYHRPSHFDTISTSSLPGPVESCLGPGMKAIWREEGARPKPAPMAEPPRSHGRAGWPGGHRRRSVRQNEDLPGSSTARSGLPLCPCRHPPTDRSTHR